MLNADRLAQSPISECAYALNNPLLGSFLVLPNVVTFSVKAEAKLPNQAMP